MSAAVGVVRRGGRGASRPQRGGRHHRARVVTKVAYRAPNSRESQGVVPAATHARVGWHAPATYDVVQAGGHHRRGLPLRLPRPHRSGTPNGSTDHNHRHDQGAHAHAPSQRRTRRPPPGGPWQPQAETGVANAQRERAPPRLQPHPTRLGPSPRTLLLTSLTEGATPKAGSVPTGAQKKKERWGSSAGAPSQQPLVSGTGVTARPRRHPALVQDARAAGERPPHRSAAITAPDAERIPHGHVHHLVRPSVCPTGTPIPLVCGPPWVSTAHAAARRCLALQPTRPATDAWSRPSSPRVITVGCSYKAPGQQESKTSSPSPRPPWLVRSKPQRIVHRRRLTFRQEDHTAGAAQQRAPSCQPAKHASASQQNTDRSPLVPLTPPPPRLNVTPRRALAPLGNRPPSRRRGGHRRPRRRPRDAAAGRGGGGTEAPRHAAAAAAGSS